MNLNLLASLLRTAVPVLAGAVLTLTGALGIPVDSVQVAVIVTAALTGAYYLVFRLAEQAAARLRWEPLRRIAGVLLGWARPPEYKEPPLPGTVQLRVHLDADTFGRDLQDAVRRNLSLGYRTEPFGGAGEAPRPEAR